MKKTALPLALLIGGLSLVLINCKKSIQGRTDNIAGLKPANVDLNAGAWKPVLLTRPDTFAVAAPSAVTSADYVAELNEIHGYQNNLSGDQQSKISYWGAGGVLRWNEIMRDLVAKYNLPPYQNPDGTYPIPSSANPFAYPLFPFANPPYAARAYAYVSAAQYDALVACWYYKKLYNRARPYAVDSTILAKMPATTLPSYPSEAAVLAGVTAEMMKLLFPDEIANINLKAQDAENAAIMAGTATRSDVVAGDALGRQIAELFITRAKADGASKAVGTQANWTALVTTAQSKGEIPWYSVETPQRPPMLPLFGNVTPFLFDTGTTTALRPGPPPSTSSDQMKQETQEAYDHIKNATRDDMKIVSFWADGVGTYTPPGHWDAIAAEDFITQNYSEVRWARNMALLNMALNDAAIVCWNTKYYYFNPRPCQLNPGIKTLTGVPNFPAYISGHSTFSGAAATILGYIIPGKAADYNAMAQQASLSRQLAGIHYKSDCTVGITVGDSVGSYAIKRAMSDGAN